jgi:hypothetical protein
MRKANMPGITAGLLRAQPRGSSDGHAAKGRDKFAPLHKSVRLKVMRTVEHFTLHSHDGGQSFRLVRTIDKSRWIAVSLRAT